MTTAEILIAAKALISDPEKWVKGADGLASKDDDPVDWALDADDPNAFCFCAGGAIQRAAGDVRGSLAALDAFARATSVQYAYQYNDRPETTHADVMAAFDLSIEAVSR